jgi:hypothetical protein
MAFELLFMSARGGVGKPTHLKSSRLKKPNSLRKEGGKPRVIAVLASRQNLSVTAELPKASLTEE